MSAYYCLSDMHKQDAGSKMCLRRHYIQGLTESNVDAACQRIAEQSYMHNLAGILRQSTSYLFVRWVLLLQEHAERPHVVQRLIAEAHMLVQSAQQLEVRLDKDIAKLQVGLCPAACLQLNGSTWSFQCC